MSRRNTATEEQAALRWRTSHYLGHVNRVPFHSSRKPGKKMPMVRDQLEDFFSSSKVEASKDRGGKTSASKYRPLACGLNSSYMSSGKFGVRDTRRATPVG